MYVGVVPRVWCVSKCDKCGHVKFGAWMRVPDVSGEMRFVFLCRDCVRKYGIPSLTVLGKPVFI